MLQAASRLVSCWLKPRLTSQQPTKTTSPVSNASDYSSSALFHHFNDDEAVTWCFHFFLFHTRTIVTCCQCRAVLSEKSHNYSSHWVIEKPTRLVCAKQFANPVSTLIVCVYVVATAMHCAASKGHVGCLATLLRQRGVDIDAADRNGCTALSYAASYGHCGAVCRLAESHADTDHRDNHGRTWVPVVAYRCFARRAGPDLNPIKPCSTQPGHPSVGMSEWVPAKAGA